jgi:hypothetical protein
MKKITGVVTLLFSILLFVSCDKDKGEDTVDGLKPIYASEAELNSIEVRSNEVLEKPGKIYVYEHYLLVNDVAKGIHIYDKSDIGNPKEVSFIAIQGNIDFSVKDGLLYADNIRDMIIIDISQPEMPVFKNRIPNVFPVIQTPDVKGAFECIDETKGPVVGWEKAKLSNREVCYN